MTYQTQKLSAPEAIGASTAEEINPKNTDRAPAEKGRIRSPVVEGGRKKLTQKDPRIIPAIEEIISEHTIGDPQDTSKWLSTSAKNIQTCLKEKHNINLRIGSSLPVGPLDLDFLDL